MRQGCRRLLRKPSSFFLSLLKGCDNLLVSFNFKANEPKFEARQPKHCLHACINSRFENWDHQIVCRIIKKFRLVILGITILKSLFRTLFTGPRNCFELERTSTQGSSSYRDFTVYLYCGCHAADNQLCFQFLEGVAASSSLLPNIFLQKSRSLK